MFGKISRPIVGIQYIDITPSVQQEYALTVDHGIYIKDVLSDLSADKAGIQI
jgi:S1-C subfamily serine protease